ncbi:MAG: alpha/beta hydrolase [Clostridia bacterium]|nr:alpha/beta hydrolase [Clostridia bacterium]
MNGTELFLWILIPALAVVALVGVAFYFTLRYVYRRVFYSPPDHAEDPFDLFEDEKYAPAKEGMMPLIEELLGYPYEEVSIKSHDGLTLYARYYQVKEGAPVDIMCHGYRGSAIRDFCGGARFARMMAHNILLIDQRAMGKSEGTTITFGILERFDVLGWANYIAERFGKETKIYLYGISMGASTVVMCRALPLPENVVGIFADCPYDTPYHIIEKVATGQGFPKKATMRLICLAAKWLGGFDLQASDCIRAMQAESNLPVYLVHGSGDTFVPSFMSENIHAANPEGSKLLLVEGADHGMSFMTCPEKYREYVGAFVREGEK